MYHIILKNLKEYGIQGLTPRTKVCHQLNGIRCDKLPLVIATVSALPDKYEKNFSAAAIYLSQYNDK